VTPNGVARPVSAVEQAILHHHHDLPGEVIGKWASP
jgi:hypothetical protein